MDTRNDSSTPSPSGPSLETLFDEIAPVSLSLNLNVPGCETLRGVHLTVGEAVALHRHLTELFQQIPWNAPLVVSGLSNQAD